MKKIYKGVALANQMPAPRLTKAQAAKVKSLIEDEGETRAARFTRRCRRTSTASTR